MSEFFEAYKDPRWQRKRLEIMNRAGFECERCGESQKTLNVHHGCYFKDRKPWDYPDALLHCWCEVCHDKFTWQSKALTATASALSEEDTVRLLAYASAMLSLVKSFRVELSTESDAKGWCDFWGIAGWENYVGSVVDERDAHEALNAGRE